MFVDSVQVAVRAGKGGDGLRSWRREKFIAKGGPDGGDGGDGGSIYVVADHNTNTLAAFRHSPLVKADDGQDGRHQKQHGKSGEDVAVKVPPGTVIVSEQKVLADLTQDGQRVLVARGGKGGFGNAHFTSSTRRAPRVAEVGEEGQEFQLQLELKLIADVGLIGLPNAGKSTLLSVISNAKPEIADYPFTTLVPNLGVVDIDNASILVADIPGLIEGASQGKGLGDEFLRHVERTQVVLHLIDASQDDITTAYKTIRRELKTYTKNLATIPQLLVLTKADMVKDSKLRDAKRQLKQLAKDRIFTISAVAHQNLNQLLRSTYKLVEKQAKQATRLQPDNEVGVITLADDPNAWWVEKPRASAYVIKGQKIEGFAKRTDFKNQDGEARFRNIMHKLGIDRELVRLNVSPGDKIQVAGKSFKW